MNSWEVGALWGEPGRGHGTEKPIIGAQGYREEVCRPL